MGTACVSWWTWPSRRSRVSSRLGRGADGKENVRRDRRDRDTRALARGQVAERDVRLAGGRPQRRSASTSPRLVPFPSVRAAGEPRRARFQAHPIRRTAHPAPARFPAPTIPPGRSAGRGPGQRRARGQHPDTRAGDAVIRIQNRRCLRGTIKLARALTTFGIHAAGAVTLDLGAAGGGFTQAPLDAGAAGIYAGTFRLRGRLRADPRVISVECTNLAGSTRTSSVSR
jgi:hypothetical protein